MGFGILFIGYLLTFFLSLVPVFGFVVRLAGCALMAIALLRLREYGREFRYPLWASYLLMVYCIYSFVSNGLDELAIEKPAFFDILAKAEPWVSLFTATVLNAALLYAVYVIASRLELPKIRNAAIRNAIIVTIYFIIGVLYVSPLSKNENFVKYIGLPMILLQIIWIILDLAVIFSCYMYICPVGDEEMPRKKTNIGFVDKMLEESDRRMDQAAKDTDEYMKKKRAERMARSERKKK